MMSAIVYKVTNKVNGKIYIGITTQMARRRWSCHRSNARRQRGYGIFVKAIRKYGEDSFVFEVIKTMETMEEAMSEERRLIAELRPQYNVAQGGEGTLGVRWTEEHREKSKRSLKAAWTEERRAKARLRELGKKLSPQTIEKIRERKLDPKNSKSVICLSDGALFESAKAAGAAYGIREGSIRAVLSGEYLSTRGKHFRYGDSLPNEQDRLAELRKREEEIAGACRRAATIKGRPVIDIKTGIVYDSIADAASALNVAPMTVVRVANGLSSTTGLNLIFEDVYNGDTAIKARRWENKALMAGLIKSHQTRKCAATLAI